MPFFVRAGLKTGTHDKRQVSHTKGAEAKKALLGIEAFWLKIGLPDSPVNGDNNSIGVLSPTRSGKHLIFHSRKGTLAHFLPCSRAG